MIDAMRETFAPPGAQEVQHEEQIMILIEGDDAVCAHWLQTNPDGYVINLQTGRKAMAHRVECSHINPPTATMQHTHARPKACGDDRDALKRWVRARMQGDPFSVTPCPDCLREEKGRE
jgi:hypothetical protein